VPQHLVTRYTYGSDSLVCEAPFWVLCDLFSSLLMILIDSIAISQCKPIRSRGQSAPEFGDILHPRIWLLGMWDPRHPLFLYNTSYYYCNAISTLSALPITGMQLAAVTPCYLSGSTLESMLE
jgi:hypothetical protein